MAGDPNDAQRFCRDWLKRGTPVVEAAPWLRLGRMPFSEVAERARDARQPGQHIVLLTDWQSEGPDAGVPCFEPDPALGGWEGLERAATECRAHGLSLVLQVRVNPVLPRSELYRIVLHRFATVDRWGEPHTVLGWHRGRVTAEWLVSGQRGRYVNTGHPGYRAWLVNAAERIAEKGVAGLHLQGFFPNVLDFNPTLGTTPDRAMWAEPLNTLKAMTEAGRRHVPGFRITVEERRDLLGEPLP